MPKFYKQNKKRIDPRYFLNERMEGHPDIPQYSYEQIDKLLSDTRHEPTRGVEHGFFTKGQSDEQIALILHQRLSKLGWSGDESSNLKIIDALEQGAYIDSIGEYHGPENIAKAIANVIEKLESGSSVDPRAADLQRQEQPQNTQGAFAQMMSKYQ